MIYYLVQADHSYTMGKYLQAWGGSLDRRIHSISYDELPERKEFGAGTYIFSDIERLDPLQIDVAAQIWHQLSRDEEHFTVYNHPRHSMRRPELLDFLAREGSNRFRAYRAASYTDSLRYPVFVRHAFEHSGTLTRLLENEKDLNWALLHLVGTHGHSIRDLLVVEFCDTADSHGWYRKYSSFMVGGKIVPRHLIFGRNWQLKAPVAVEDEALQQEEMRYLDENPHREELRRIFETARVEYGRVDYSVMQGSLQVWEINTNPMILQEPERFETSQMPAQLEFARRIKDAFKAIDLQPDSSIAVPVTVRPKTMRSMRNRDRRQRQINFVSRLYGMIVPSRIRPYIGLMGARVLLILRKFRLLH